MSKKNCHNPYIETIISRINNKYVPLRGVLNEIKQIDGLELPVRLLPYLLDICPVGDGHLYEIFVSACLQRMLGA